MRCWYFTLCWFALCALAGAEEPPHYTFLPPPPGTIVQSRLVYLAGEAMHSQWRGVLSKKLVGIANGTAFYQWYLSFYAIDGTIYRLKYRSPDSRIPFDRVIKARGASLWFPLQSASIAGVGEFMGAGAQQLVVQSRQITSGCGTARVDVFFFDAAMQVVMTTLSVENRCDLAASVIPQASGDALRLTAPHETAILRFHNGTWTEHPKYFKILE